MPRRDQIGLWLPVIVWAAVIFAFSAQPAASLPDTGNLLQKGAHLGEYAVLGTLLWRALAGHGLRRAIVLAIAWPAVVIYAVSDEFHQMFTPGRHPSIVDVGIDSLGAILGMLLASLLSDLRSSHKDVAK